MASKSEPAVRSDVRRNRQLLLDAARDLFGTSQVVPLYEVARRAGVGQATLYRHFPDRATLATALMDEELDRLRAVTAGREDDPACLDALLQSMVESQVRLHHLAEIVREGPHGDTAFAHVRRQANAIFAGPLAAAQDAGVARQDLTTEDLLLIPRMLDGALHYVENHRQRAQVAQRCLMLLQLGYTTRGD